MGNLSPSEHGSKDKVECNPAHRLLRPNLVDVTQMAIPNDPSDKRFERDLLDRKPSVWKFMDIIVQTIHFVSAPVVATSSEPVATAHAHFRIETVHTHHVHVLIRPAVRGCSISPDIKCLVDIHAELPH